MTVTRNSTEAATISLLVRQQKHTGRELGQEKTLVPGYVRVQHEGGKATCEYTVNKTKHLKHVDIVCFFCFFS